MHLDRDIDLPMEHLEQIYNSYFVFFIILPNGELKRETKEDKAKNDTEKDNKLNKAWRKNLLSRIIVFKLNLIAIFIFSNQFQWASYFYIKEYQRIDKILLAVF